MKTKRLLSVLLAVCMLVSMSAAAGLVANAEDNTPVIEVSNVPEAEVGKTPVEGSVDVPEGAKYTAEVQWYVMEDWDGQPTSASFNGTFTKGYTYGREITISIADGWEGWQYVDEYGAVLCDIVINGEYAGDVWAYEEDGKACHENFFNFTEKIESAEITGVVDAVAGAQATTDGIKAPADANYTVKAQWYTYDETYIGEEFSGAFVKGEVYGLELTLIAAEGYSFDDKCVVKVNGEEQDSSMGVANMYRYVYLEYNLSEDINEVEITNTEKAVVGQKPSVDGVSVSENVKNANYTVAAQWFMYDEEQGAVLVTDEFAKGNVYYLMIFVEANDGYKFAEDAVIKLNGATLAEDYYMNAESIVMVIGDFAGLGLKAIDKVEITAEPEIGKTPSEVKVTVPEDAHYSVSEVYWYDIETGMEIKDDKFEEGKTYGLSVSIVADKGYYLNLVVETLINGMSQDDYEYLDAYYYIKGGYVDVELEGGAKAIQNPIADNKPAPGNTSNQNNTITKSPATGDTNMMFPMVALLILSVVGIVVVLELKKREYDI